MSPQAISSTNPSELIYIQLSQNVVQISQDSSGHYACPKQGCNQTFSTPAAVSTHSISCEAAIPATQDVHQGSKVQDKVQVDTICKG